MEFKEVLINVAAIFAGLIIYIVIMKTPVGKKHENMQYLIMLIALIGAVIVGYLIRLLTRL
ncbi:MAG: hypothetical protein K6F00_09020 [Lachnospiraceae bacterium]|nr:hypothetical protein [Lachnospiraceae bacterium]